MLMETRIPLLKKKRSSLQYTIRGNLSRYTCLYKTARKIFQLCRYFKWKVICQFRKLGNRFDFDFIYSVKTNSILLCTEKEFDPYLHDALLLGGDWDISTKEFKDLDVFIAFSDHFLNDVAWEETQYYKSVLNRITEGYVPWRCANEDDLRKRFESFDALHRQIRVNGYKKQTEISPMSYDIRKIDEISVNLDRNGNLLFNNSAHRLSIAKILGIEAIPVRVTVCHVRCSNFEALHLVGKD